MKIKPHFIKKLNKIICAKVKADDKNLINELAKKTEGFIGSEIEEVVISALCDAFFENRALEVSDFEKAIENTVPLSKTQKESIIAIREWANVRAVSASSKESTKIYKEDTKNPQDITSTRGGRRLDI